MNLKDMFAERKRVHEEQKALNDAVLARGDGYTAEEKEKDERFEARMVELTDLIARARNIAEREEELSKPIEERKADLDVDPEEVEERLARGVETTTLDHASVRYMRQGRDGLRPEERVKWDKEMSEFRQFLTKRGEYPELRALQADKDVSGGYTVAPQQFVAELIKGVDDELFIRRLAKTIMVTSSDSIGAPSLDNDPADPIWTSEIGTGDEDSTMSFGGRELHPHPLAKRIKVADKLIRVSALPVDSIVRDRMGYKIGRTMENAYLNGNGAGQPMGVFTAAPSASFGITTGQDVSTGNTNTTIEADGLIECKYALKSQYHSRAVWLFHRTAIKNIRKLKDGEGQYIWKAGLANDPQDTILGSPVYMSELAPSTFTSGLYVGIYGDFSRYWIADLLGARMKVLYELYAETDQIGYITRMESDGMPVLEEAFARVTLA